MTRTLPPDELTPDEPAAKPRRPRAVYLLGGLAIIVFLVGLTGGSFQGKLADVQKNDNSQYLPGSADSTKVLNESDKFNSIQSIPGFIVYQRTSGLTATDKAKIAADAVAFRSLEGVARRPGRPAAVHRYRRLDLGAAHRRGQRQGARRPDTGRQREPDH